MVVVCQLPIEVCQYLTDLQKVIEHINVSQPSMRLHLCSCLRRLFHQKELQQQRVKTVEILSFSNRSLPPKVQSACTPFSLLQRPQRGTRLNKNLVCWQNRCCCSTHGLLRFLPSKLAFWKTTTHTMTYKQASLAKLTCFFSTRLQAETLANLAEMKKKLLAHIIF